MMTCPDCWRRMVVNTAGAQLDLATSAQCYTGGLFGTLFLPSIIGGDVVRLVVGQGMRLALAGAAVGLVGALALGRVLRSLLYEVGPADPFTYSAVLVVAMAVAAVACYLPAYRATTVDPISALRSE